jgi:hypothetical protein
MTPMKTMLSAWVFTAIILLNCPGQDAVSQSPSNVVAMTAITPTRSFGDWAHFATNNVRAKQLVQQKRDLDSQIVALRK